MSDGGQVTTGHWVRWPGLVNRRLGKQAGAPIRRELHRDSLLNGCAS